MLRTVMMFELTEWCTFRQISFLTIVTDSWFDSAFFAFCFPVMLAFFICKYMSQVLQRIRFNKSLVVMRSMNGAGKQYKIFQSIISNLAVNMMNYFVRCYRALEMFRHHQDAPANISGLSSIRMFWFEDKNTPICIGANTTLPVRVSCSMPRSFWSTHISNIMDIQHIVKGTIWQSTR